MATAAWELCPGRAWDTSVNTSWLVGPLQAVRCGPPHRQGAGADGSAPHRPRPALPLRVCLAAGSSKCLARRALLGLKHQPLQAAGRLRQGCPSWWPAGFRSRGALVPPGRAQAGWMRGGSEGRSPETQDFRPQKWCRHRCSVTDSLNGGPRDSVGSCDRLAPWSLPGSRHGLPPRSGGFVGSSPPSPLNTSLGRYWPALAGPT